MTFSVELTAQADNDLRSIIAAVIQAVVSRLIPKRDVTGFSAAASLLWSFTVFILHTG
jgi:hypothetical protein